MNSKLLFTLTYNKYKLVYRFIFPTLVILCGSLLMIFDWSSKAVKTVDRYIIICGGILLLYSALYYFVQNYMCKNIKFYSDRVVKSWYCFGDQTVMLNTASLSRFNNILMCKNTIYYRHVKFPSITGIAYDEYLADAFAITELHTILSELSKIDIKNFDRHKIKIDKLIS